MSAPEAKDTKRPDKPPRSIVAIEVTLAIVPFLWIMSHANLRALIVTCYYAVYDGARSSLFLIPTDPGTIVTALGALARVVLLLAPLVRVFVLSPRHRLAWIPISVVIWVGVLGTSVPAFSSVLMWGLLLAASGVAWFVAIRPYLSVVALLPWVIALEPMLGHSPLGDTYWSTARLAERCASNDGVRAVDMKPEYAIARYFGVTPVTPDLVLATGERRSFWVRRDADGTPHLGEALPVMGNMWQGCVRDGMAWLTHRQFIWELPVPRNGELAVAATRHQVLGGPELGPELDYVDTICPAQRSSVYSSQLVRGGFLEFDKNAGTTHWHPVIRGLNLQLVERSDGLLVGITTGRLVVFDPRKDRVIDEQPAGTVAMGIDICRSDDAIVVTDFAGRVRLFEIGSDGRYVFTRAGFSPAARRTSFSPDCSKIAVTSGNDRNLFILKRADMSRERTYSLGPGLRDIVFLDNRWVAAADACVISFVDTAR
jgi:hypothetical protein